MKTNFTHFVELIFDTFNQKGIRYLVLRNYAKLPEETDNDIDLLVSRSQKGLLLSILRSVAQKSHWKICKIAEFACSSIFFYHEETLEQVHIDLMFDICWHSFLFADTEEILRRRIPHKTFYKPAPCHEAMVNLLTRLVYGGYVKEKYRPFIQEVATREKINFINTLSWSLRLPLAETLASFSEQGKWSEIENRGGLVRKAILLHQMHTPFSLFFRILSDGFRLIHRAFHVPGKIVLLRCSQEEKAQEIVEKLKSSTSGTFQVARGFTSTIPTTRPISFLKCWPHLFRNGICFYILSEETPRKNTTSQVVILNSETESIHDMIRKLIA